MTDPGRFGDWETVADVPELYQADLIALRLEEAGIETQVLDQSAEQFTIPGVRSFARVRVLVPVDKVEQAKEALSREATVLEDAEYDPDPEDDNGSDDP
jgi:hypothetical protein